MNSDNKRVYILLGILAVVVVIYLWSIGVFEKVFSFGSSEPIATEVVQQPAVYTQNTALESRSPATTTDSGVDPIDLTEVVKEFRFDGAWVRDPFYYYNSDSLEKALLGFANLRLTGVSLRNGADFTLINFVMYNDVDTLENVSILKEGDLIGSFTVETIAFDHVILMQGARRMRLTLYEE